jgi:hypothetical protein
MARNEGALRPSGAAIEATESRDREIDRVRRAVEGLRFGEVRLIIQDGVIVQIERVEKERLR